MNARALASLVASVALTCVAALAAEADAKTFHIPAGTVVALRALAAGPSAGTPGDAVILLQVDRDVMISGQLVFARGALARGSLARRTSLEPPVASRVPRGRKSGAGVQRLEISWVMDTSGDKVTAVGSLPIGTMPLSATIREQDVNVPDTYDPSVR